MLAGLPLISKEQEKGDSIVMKSFCHRHGPRFCFRGRWVIEPKKTFVEQMDVQEGTLPAADVVQQLLASVIEHQRCCVSSQLFSCFELRLLLNPAPPFFSSWMQCNGVLSLGYTGAYFDATCVAAQIDNLKKLSPQTVEKLVDAYCDRVTENKVSLLRQVPSPPLLALQPPFPNRLQPTSSSLTVFDLSTPTTASPATCRSRDRNQKSVSTSSAVGPIGTSRDARDFTRVQVVLQPRRSKRSWTSWRMQSARPKKRRRKTSQRRARCGYCIFYYCVSV